MEMTYEVPAMHCEHCKRAVETEVGQVAGVTRVDVDLQAKRVRVSGEELSDSELRAAIDEAGYEAQPA